jgi:transcriptional regulator of arginine metabolism
MKLSKNQRQHRIIQFIEQQAVTSQGQLVELLSAGGVLATQATVSRDLDEIGAVKVRAAGGESVYAVPELPKDALRPGLPTWWPPPWTGPGWRKSWGLWPAMTPSW